MNILLATSEAVPFAKTGGLADVCGALPVELAKLGHQAAVIMPAYAGHGQNSPPAETTGIDLSVQIGSKNVRGRLLKSMLPGSQVPVYLVDQPDYYHRPGLYGVNGQDFIDNCERFVFFSRAVLEAVRLLELPVDVLHCNDWQTALIPAYLRAEYRGVPGFENIGALFTIHNLAYQGNFWHWDMLLTGLDWKYFNWQQMEFYGKLNLMKTGLVFSDAINTVSPTYAQEIQSAPLGCGLEGVLVQRRNVLSGIINGVDYREWDPAIDKYLPQQYNPKTVAAGKAACKAALQRKLGLKLQPRTPLLAFIGRLADQKGLDLIAPVVPQWMEQDAQWAFLGTGDPKYHDTLTQLAAGNPGKIAARLEFSNGLAHEIEAAADILLMPSRYEPCGLNQLYSLKYGTVPVVRATGGLADTIIDTTDATLANGTATGFLIQEHTTAAFAQTLRHAVDTYQQTETWNKLIAHGMAQDWSWGRSAKEYSRLYQRVSSQQRQPATV
ncbi:MAG: glycogen synthase GlgA [Pirellulales bacterium]